MHGDAGHWSETSSAMKTTQQSLPAAGRDYAPIESLKEKIRRLTKIANREVFIYHLLQEHSHLTYGFDVLSYTYTVHPRLSEHLAEHLGIQMIKDLDN